MVRQSVAFILCSAALRFCSTALRLRSAAFRCVIVAGSRLAVVAVVCWGDDAYSEEAENGAAVENSSATEMLSGVSSMDLKY